MLFPSLKIQLKPSIVQPILDVIRETVETSAGPTSELHLNPDLTALLSLFPPDFASTAEISISSSHQAQSILRACTLLRKHFRCGPLAGISDEQLESDEEFTLSDPATKQYQVEMSFLFLAIIQQTLLDNVIEAAPPNPLERTFSRASQLIQELWSKPKNLTPDSTTHEVWVHNDSVNIMPYVTSVIQHVLKIPQDAAERHMREVHHQKKSLVWRGAQSDAEAITSRLRSWHLSATTRLAI